MTTSIGTAGNPRNRHDLVRATDGGPSGGVLPRPGPQPALVVALADELKVRIGANTGPVVAGVIGKRKFAYDLWGDAVNTASRMESHGLAGEIQITASTQERVKGAFELESRGMIQVKGKGELPAWFVRGPKVLEA